jgi:hypothetical protein
MSWFVYLFGGGLIFFVGAGLILLAVAVSLRRSGGWSRAATAAALVGLVFVLASATPLPNWFYALATVLTCAWLIAVAEPVKLSTRTVQVLRLSVAVAWLAGVATELPYHFLPTLRHVESRRLTLFGDSLSAGLTTDTSHNWPSLLAQAHGLELVDHARAGATVATALQ